MVQSGVTKEGLFVEGMWKLRPSRFENEYLPKGEWVFQGETSRSWRGTRVGKSWGLKCQCHQLDEYPHDESKGTWRRLLEFQFYMEWKLLEDCEQVTWSDGHLEKIPAALVCRTDNSESGCGEIREEVTVGRIEPCLITWDGKAPGNLQCRVERSAIAMCPALSHFSTHVWFKHAHKYEQLSWEADGGVHEPKFRG